MDLLNNPFYILAASPRDNRRKLMEQAEERSLLFDAEPCTEASTVLTTPRKRLSAEVAWLPGVGPKRAEEILVTLESAPIDLIATEKLTSIARANALSAGLTRLTDHTTDNITPWIFELSATFEDVKSEELRSIINDDRIVSGFPEVSDLSAVEAEIQERRRYYLKTIRSALDNLSPKELVEAITFVVETETYEGYEQAPVLITDLVDAYEVDAQDFLEKEGENINALVARLRTTIESGRPDDSLAPIVDQLIQVVKNWDFVAQPIQLNAKSRGLDHDASHRIARIVRDLAIFMFNEHDKLEFSQQITSMLQEVFAEVDEVAERTAEDADALQGIAEQRVRLIKEAQSKAEEWRKEITYEADVGIIFKDKLRISPEGIEWKGQHWDLDSITRVRWGGTSHSVNGIPSGSTYSIYLGSASRYTTIELKKEAIYSNFIERLWRAVCVRLLTEFLLGLRDGKTYYFGSSAISDQGIVLERKKFFGSNEQVFCRWNEVVSWNGAGYFYIGKRSEKKMVSTFSYQDQDNIHILSAAINMLKGNNKLSSLLGN